MVYVYVLRDETGKRYVGITNDIGRRVAEHRAKHSKAGQLLRNFQLVLTEEYTDYAAAREREKFLKSGQGRQWLDDHLDWPEPA